MLVAASRGGKGKDHSPGRVGGTAARRRPGLDQHASLAPPDADDSVSGQDAPRVQPGGQCVRERRHAAGQADGGWLLPARGHAPWRHRGRMLDEREALVMLWEGLQAQLRHKPAHPGLDAGPEPGRAEVEAARAAARPRRKGQDAPA